MSEQAAKPKRYPTLPNCDICGRFTSSPTEKAWFKGGNSGFDACYWLLLCPKCATEEKP